MTIRKTLLAAAPITLLALSLTACGSNSGDDPASVANAYMEAVQAQDYEKVQELLTAESASDFAAPPQEIIDQITPVEAVSVADFTVEEGATTVEPDVSYTTADGRETGTSIELIKDEDAGWKVDTILGEVSRAADILGVPAEQFGGQDVSEYTLLAGSTVSTWDDNELFNEYSYDGIPDENELREGVKFKDNLEESLRPQLEEVIEEGVDIGWVGSEVCDFADKCEPIIASLPSSYDFSADPIQGVIFSFDDLILNDLTAGELTQRTTSGEVTAMYYEGELDLSYGVEAG